MLLLWGKSGLRLIVSVIIRTDLHPAIASSWVREKRLGSSVDLGERKTSWCLPVAAAAEVPDSRQIWVGYSDRYPGL